MKNNTNDNAMVNNYKRLIAIAKRSKSKEIGMVGTTFYQIIDCASYPMFDKVKQVIIYQEVYIKHNCIIKRGTMFAMDTLKFIDNFKIYNNESNNK